MTLYSDNGLACTKPYSLSTEWNADCSPHSSCAGHTSIRFLLLLCRCLHLFTLFLGPVLLLLLRRCYLILLSLFFSSVSISFSFLVYSSHPPFVLFFLSFAVFLSSPFLVLFLSSSIVFLYSSSLSLIFSSSLFFRSPLHSIAFISSSLPSHSLSSSSTANERYLNLRNML